MVFGFLMFVLIAVFQGIFNYNQISVPEGRVTASSQMPGKELGPEELLRGYRKIWHAQSPPQYPEWIEIKYRQPKTFNTFGLRPQSGNQNEYKRAPIDFQLQGSNDKINWSDLLEVKGASYENVGGWQYWSFNNSKAYLYYRTKITAGGHRDILSLRQIELH